MMWGWVFDTRRNRDGSLFLATRQTQQLAKAVVHLFQFSDQTHSDGDRAEPSGLCAIGPENGSSAVQQILDCFSRRKREFP
jgi:hypothetical protein